MTETGRRFATQLPEPLRLWIAQSPRTWSAAGQPWLHFATGRFLRPRSTPAWQSVSTARCAGVVYLPPVDEPFRAQRDAVAERLVTGRAVPLVHLAPGEPFSIAHARPVYDLLPAVLARDFAPLAMLPADAETVWPLIPGVSDQEDQWQAGCQRLAEAGVRSVQAVVADVQPVDRQWLAEGRDEAAFDQLFHGSAPNPRAFARVAAAHGLAPFVRRPRHGLARVRRNRAVAEALALAGELWLRLGRREIAGQAFLRAARGADDTTYDLAAVARDGNLDVLGWLDDASRTVVEDVLESGTSSLVVSLTERYLDDDRP